MRMLPSFFLAATICETHSVGSDTGVIAPILTIPSNSLLTHSYVARGTLRVGLPTGEGSMGEIGHQHL